MNPLEQIHEGTIHRRRVRILAAHMARHLEPGAHVLDIGTGDGTLAALISQHVGNLKMEGVEVLPRKDCPIKVTAFDGSILPFEDNSFDAVIFSDVLHHVDKPMGLLAEAVRVCRAHVIIKDHFRKGVLAGSTLKFMDKVGNARYRVPVPGNYWTESQWNVAFDRIGLVVETLETKLKLYPWFLNWWFGRSLHFIARLRKAKKERSST